MPFKVLTIVRAPGSNPETDRCFLKNESIETTTIAFDPSDNQGIIDTCVNMTENNQLHAILLCPAVSNELIATLSKLIGDKVAIFAGKGDFKSVFIASEITKKEWSF